MTAELLSVNEYRRRILSALVPLPPRSLALSEALGCVLAADVPAPFDIPPFTSSAMDGYALRAVDTIMATADAPVGLRLVGEIPMGEPARNKVGPGEAVSVPTGGMIPSGADSVVASELCIRSGDVVGISAPSLPGRNIRPVGEDRRAGQPIATVSEPLGPVAIGALAAAGIAYADVVPRPRVGILSTGDELVQPGAELAEAKTYDSNSYMLGALVQSAGDIPVDLGRVPDDPSQLLAALENGLERVDLFLCSAGVSAGANDPVRRAFAPGSDVCCVGVAMTPGRPQAFGIWHGKPFIGLAGNPVAALVSFHVFVQPALRRMRGIDPDNALTAVLDGCIESPGARTRFLPATLSNKGGMLVVNPLPAAGSNILHPMVSADCLLEVPAGGRLLAGEPCRVIPVSTTLG